MSTLFIADLHLQQERPELTRAFLQFIHHKAAHAEALYILGDLFEVWVGDDNPCETATAVATGLLQLSESETRVYLQHGNRDFLIGTEFAARCGATLLPERCAITPYKEPLLLMHGDQLCLDDTEYQQFRAQVRSDPWQQQFLAMPLSQRLSIAADMRLKSSQLSEQKSSSIMDISAPEADRVMASEKTDTLIHGHTHRPAIHKLGGNRQRIVLGDWGPSVWYLEWKADDSYRLIDYPVEA